MLKAVLTNIARRARLRVRQPLFCLFFCFFSILGGAQQAYANQTYYTDADNTDNANSGAPDGDMDVLISVGDGEHPIEFNIDTTGASLIVSARLVVSAFDVDDGPDGSGVGSGNESDEVYLNGVLVGTLIGEEARNSTTTFDVTGTAVIGANLVEVIVDSDLGTSLRVNSGQILINGGAQATANNSEVALSGYTTGGGVVTLDADVNFDALATGNFRVELNFIDPSGNLLNVLSEDFPATSGDNISRTYNPTYIIFEPDGTYELEALVFYDSGGFDVLQERQLFTFDHLQSVGPILPADPINSTMSTGATELVANGVTSTTITIQGIDVGGNVLSYGGQTVLLSTNAGSISGVTDNNDGTYTALLTSPTSTSTATVTGTINGELMTESVTVDFIPGPPSTATSTVDIGHPTLFADGTSTTTVTIQLFDMFGNALTQGGNSITAFTTSGTLSNVSDLGNGTYTAILTASTDVVSVTVTANIDGALIVDDAGINFITGPASTVTSELSVSLPDIYADGLTQSIITLQTIDIGNNPLFVGGDLVTINTNLGSMGPVTDNGNGSYTAVLTSSVGAGTAFVTATINNALANDTEFVGFIDRPTVTPIITNTATPTITGSIQLIAGASLSVVVNGQTYIPGDGNLFRVGNTWTLNIPGPNALAEGVYSVTAAVTDSGAQTTIDSTSDELELDLTPPTITLNALPFIDGLNTTTYSVSGSCTNIGDTLVITASDADTDTVVTPALTCMNDGFGLGVYSTSMDLRTLSDGAITIDVVIDDIAGNQATVSGTTAKDACLPNDDVLVCDTDLDTIPNGIERLYGLNPDLTDSDGDGISDEDEFGSNIYSPFDTDNDGTIDALDDDSDNDGIADVIELGGTPLMPVDSDNDGIFDFQDRDSDSDYIPDSVEFRYALSDPDNDSIPNYLDRDSDGDGLPDALENGVTRLLDGDGDGVDDAFDPDWTLGLDSNRDFVDDAVQLLDSDLDGFFNVYDIDADNDGMRDTLESNLVMADADSDGIIDEFDVDTLSRADANSDGIIDDAVLLDSDGDGVEDYRDLDSDNDSLADVVESGGIDTSPQDAMIDSASTNQGQTISPTDTDGDGIPNYLDLESTNILNNGNQALFDINSRIDAIDADANGDGLVDDSRDDDNDGIGNFVDETPYAFGSYGDSDEDGVPNRDDLDDDNDGILDSVEGSGLIDSDGDGWADNADPDSDNDGITDLTESQSILIDLNNDGVLDGFVDADGDGVDDNVDSLFAPIDTDGDGRADYLDTDSDNDGIFDLVEVNPSSTNFSLLDANSDGRIDNIVNRGAAISFYALIDTDGDGVANYLDLDSDGDGLLDQDENGDFNGDGENDRLQANVSSLETASQGAGALAWELVLLLMVLVSSMIANKRRAQVAFGRHGLWFCLLLLPLSLTSPSAQADNSLCGLFEETEAEEKDQEKGLSGFQPCFYASFGLGVSQLEPEGASNGWSLADEKSVAGSVGLGWHFAPHWFTELNYSYLGKAGLSNANPALDEEGIHYHAPSLMLGYDLFAESKPFNAYLKLGAAVVANNETDDSIRYEQQSSVQAAFGAGVRYRFKESPWFMGMEYNSYAKDAGVLGIQFGRYFGYAKKNIQLPEPPKKIASPIEMRTIGDDTDADGVADQFDLCPLTSKGEKVDDKGCCVEKSCTVVYP